MVQDGCWLLPELASRPWPLLLLPPDVEVREPRVVLVELANLWLVKAGLVACETCQYSEALCVCGQWSEDLAGMLVVEHDDDCCCRLWIGGLV